MTPAVSLILRVGLFVLIGWLGLMLFGVLLYPLAGALVSATLAVFGAAVAANAIPIRIFEHGGLSDCGLAWRVLSRREFLLGAAMAAGFASLIVLIPMLAGRARFVPAAASEHPWASFALVTLALLFGAVGEEMLFHGYAFQQLTRTLGNFGTVLPVAVLFGLVHTGNEGANPLGIFNTMLWGGVLGFAYVRTQALWLPFGLHFGWNLALPLLGANLSGFAMSVTGYSLEWNGSTLWSGGSYGPEGGLLTTFAACALAALLPRIFPAASGRDLE